MPGMGPAPKPADQRARRNPSVSMTRLPAEGRIGPAPKWPLGGDLTMESKIDVARRDLLDHRGDIEEATTARERASLRAKITRANRRVRELEAMLKFASKVEREIWAALWKTPQSTQWEKRAWFREVALYARHQAKAEAGSLDDSKEARQREDRLGLNDMSMVRLRWEIADSAPAQGARPRSARNSRRYGNLRVVKS